MVVIINGMVVGIVDKNEYSARELEKAGFVVKEK